MRLAALILVGIAGGVVLLALLLTAIEATTTSRPLSLPRIPYLQNDTSGDVTIQPRCSDLLRQVIHCDFRDLPGYGAVPPGSGRPLIPQPPPGSTTWYRVTDASQRVVGCASVNFGIAGQQSPATDNPVIQVTQLAPCPNWDDPP